MQRRTVFDQAQKSPEHRLSRTISKSNHRDRVTSLWYLCKMIRLVPPIIDASLSGTPLETAMCPQSNLVYTCSVRANALVIHYFRNLISRAGPGFATCARIWISELIVYRMNLQSSSCYSVMTHMRITTRAMPLVKRELNPSGGIRVRILMTGTCQHFFYFIRALEQK